MSTLPLLPNAVDLESDEILCRKLAGLRYPGFAYNLDLLQTPVTDALVQLMFKNNLIRGYFSASRGCWRITSSRLIGNGLLLQR